GMMLDRAPVAAEQRVGSDKVDRASDPAAVAFGHHQKNVLAHGLADQREEFSVEVWAAPFARAGLHVKFEEGVPGFFGEVAAGEVMDGDAGGQRLAPLALDRLAMPGVQRGEKIIEIVKTLVVPVELLVGSRQKIMLGEEFLLGLARKGDVNRRGVGGVAQRDQSAGQGIADQFRIDAVADQEAWAGRRR